MQVFNIVLIILLVLLSLAAGLAKLLETPQEVHFLQGFGFNRELIIAYGALQVAGAVLFAIPKTLKIGAFITISAFMLASVLLFISAKLTFAMASMLPIGVTLFVLWQSGRLNTQYKQ